MLRQPAIVWVVVTIGGMASALASALDPAQRVSAQLAIEGVYWRHRIWPADNPDPKPSLDQMLPPSVVRARVEDYMLESEALDRIWGLPIRNEELQVEVERMAASSRAPQVLQEIFTALGNDPTLVAECLARPLLADRLIRDAYAHDPRYHLALKTSIEQSLAGHASPANAETLGGEYTETVWVRGERRRSRAGTLEGGARVVPMDAVGWSQQVSRLRIAFEPTASTVRPEPGTGSPAGTEEVEDASVADLPVGVFSGVQEDDESFFVRAVVEKGIARLRVATVVWRKRPFDEWWAGTKSSIAAGGSAEGVPGSTSQGRPTTAENGPTLSLSATSALSLPTVPDLACTKDTWATVQSSGAPSRREAHTSVWTGSEMIVWGGYDVTTLLDTNTGGRYNPATDSWSPTSTTGAPDARDTHTAVWTGAKMVIWGGGNENLEPKNTGGLYNPATNSWAPTSITNPPIARVIHTAVWSGTRMIVWGGWDGLTTVNTGGRYDPVANTWAGVTTSGAPPPRDSQTAVWTGTKMVIWGGEDANAVPLNSGGRYDPVGDTWGGITPTGNPVARYYHTAVWTGNRMVVWGGFNGSGDLNTGGRYDPTANSWTGTSTSGAPLARESAVAVWTDSLSEMVVWGGGNGPISQLSSGGRYNPSTNVWTAMSQLAAPSGRRYHTAVWTGSEMIIWGGFNTLDLDSGGRYCSGACTLSPPAGTSVLSVSKPPGGVSVSWTAVPVAAAYDLVRGLAKELQISGGDFTTATQLCVANDRVQTSSPDTNLPPTGNAFWYLVRGVSCGGAGTYNETGGSQVGSRDAEINASTNRCP